MKKKIIIITIVTLIIGVLLYIFIKNDYKILKTGNNIINKSSKEVEEYILNIESYEAIAQVQIKSNKNENTYIVKQKYIKQDNIYQQEFIEPSNINGLIIFYDGTNLKIKNTKLDLAKIYENYEYIMPNHLSLAAFIKEYKNSEEANYIEEDGKIIMEVKIKNGNKYSSYKKLVVDKTSGKLVNLEISDITQKATINIIYNEIKINNLHKEEILAFKLSTIRNDI